MTNEQFKQSVDQELIRVRAIAEKQLQEQCEHDDVDDFHCLDCGKDLTEDVMARAYDRMKDRMKYGEY